MNILVINGSPRCENSNTYRLTKAFVDGLCAHCKKSGEESSVDHVIVSKLEIKPCIGCFHCWKNTSGECCIKDDIALVLEKILWADTIIWSFPLYYFNIPGSLKTLIDRQLPLFLPFMDRNAPNGGHPFRYDMSHKQHVIISTCGFYTHSGNYGSVTEMFEHFCGKENLFSIFCGQGELLRIKELSALTDPYIQLVFQAGEEYAKHGEVSEDILAELEEPFFPRDVYEDMADASWGISEGKDKSAANF